MKKVFAGLVILLSAVLCLSGCEDNKIDDGLEKQVTEKGKEMMQAWVDENMPGAELDEAAAAFLFETLGITPEIKDFSCFVMAPAQDGESTTKTFNKYFNFGIPADVKNIDAFVREPGFRQQLEVTADLRLPEDTDLFESCGSKIPLRRVRDLFPQSGPRHRRPGVFVPLVQGDDNL